MKKLETTSARFHYVPGTAPLTRFHATLQHPKQGSLSLNKPNPLVRRFPPRVSIPSWPPPVTEVHAKEREKTNKQTKKPMKQTKTPQNRRPDLSSPRADKRMPGSSTNHTVQTWRPNKNLKHSYSRAPAGTYWHIIDTLSFGSYQENLPEVHSGRGGELGQTLGERWKHALPRRPATAEWTAWLASLLPLLCKTTSGA